MDSHRERDQFIEADMDLERRQARRAAQVARLRQRRRLVLASVGLMVALGAVAAIIASTSGSGPAAQAGRSGGGSQASAPGARSARGTRGASQSSSQSAAKAPAASGKPGTEPVPILMYHVINEPPPGAPFPGLYVPAGEFSEEMHALAAAGFHAITMDQMLAYWRDGTPLPAGKPVVLSFDNGYQSQYTNALPVLRELGWVGVENMQLTGLPPSQGGLSQAQVKGLVAAGWELDTQGFSHADLITLSPSELHYQVAVAREVVQRRYHVPVNWFCYPSGHYNQAVVEAVKAAGYSGSTTVVPGWAKPTDDLYRLPRLRVLGGTSGQALVAEIAAIESDAAPPESYGSE